MHMGHLTHAPVKHCLFKIVIIIESTSASNTWFFCCSIARAACSPCTALVSRFVLSLSHTSMCAGARCMLNLREMLALGAQAVNLRHNNLSKIGVLKSTSQPSSPVSFPKVSLVYAVRNRWLRQKHIINSHTGLTSYIEIFVFSNKVK